MLDFLGIGAQKSGTSWLYHHLAQHPQIRFPGGKEIHYWDKQYPFGIEQYHSLFTPHTSHVKQGEITPAYAILPEKSVSAIYDYAPDVRIFFITRNPIDRAWSSALMALERAEMTPEEASDQWFIDHFHSQGSRLRGDYHRTLSIWGNIFPKEQFLWLSFEQITSNPSQLLQSLCRHIGVDEHFFNINPDRINADKIFANPPYPLRPRLREVLKNIYPEIYPG